MNFITYGINFVSLPVFNEIALNVLDRVHFKESELTIMHNNCQFVPVAGYPLYLASIPLSVERRSYVKALLLTLGKISIGC